MNTRWLRFGLAAGLAVVTTACSLWPGKEETKETPTPTISPVIEVSENYYGSVPPYRQNQTRGMLSRLTPSSYRMDFSHLELGLMEIAQETFSNEDYYFQEGQQIKKEQVTAWLSRAKDDPAGVNPDQGPSLLVHVLEHDYLEKETRKLSGIVLGLSLSPVYEDASGQEKKYTVDELRAKGQQIASRIVQTVRAENQQIPMVVALYQVPDRNSTMIPGSFISTGTVNATDSSVSKWQPIDEKYYLFPSTEVEKDQPQISLQFDKLMKQIQSFFQEYVGITGTGRFMGGKMTELTITATAEYDSRTEVLQFTQYAASLINQLIDKDVHVNLYVQSINQPLSIYVRPPDGEAYMHIYRK
ncbi:MAG TPA: CamS family sex pheromone protein [Candidatus Bathyarchaeia archaeon]|nr:CamS family sex pheromone protein [Candidatus Bathyarchaeia archaeon]